MGSTAISVKSVSKSFANETVLRDISLEVAEGEFSVILGPSGCGKSTLLNCIAGLVQYDSGNISLNGTDADDLMVEDRDLGYVFQEFESTLFPHKSVGENIAFGLEQKGLAKEEIDAKTDEILELLAISETKNDIPSELSGGQQQRVELARQLVRECDIMLLDDPLADLDYKLQKRMELEMRRLHSEMGSTFVYVTHNQDQALKLADKLVVMNHGIIEQVGPPEEIYERPASAFVGRFIGDSTMFVGHATEINQDHIVVDTEIGQIDTSPGDNQIKEDDEVVVLVRPEVITIGDDAHQNDNTVSTVLEGQTYTGERTEFDMGVAGIDRSIHVVKPGKPDIGSPGDELLVGWDASDTKCFKNLSETGTVSIDELMEV